MPDIIGNMLSRSISLALVVLGLIFYCSLTTRAQWCVRPKRGKKLIALYDAIDRGDSASVARMMQAGVSPNDTEGYGRPIMFCATQDDGHAPVLKALIAAGGNVNAKMVSGIGVLQYACGSHLANEEIVQILIAAGADVNSPDLGGATPVMAACYDGNLPAVKLLIAAGANVNTVAKGGECAIDDAKYGDDEVNKELRKAIVNLLIKAGANPLGSSAPIVARFKKMKQPTSFAQFESAVGRLSAAVGELADSSLSGWNDTNVDYNDSLNAANSLLDYYLTENLPRVPESLSHAVSDMGGVEVVTSPDGRLRQWSWNTFQGGTMPDISQILEFQTKSGVYVENPHAGDNEGEASCSQYDTIYSVQKSNGQTVYLPLEDFKESSAMGGEWITALSIEDTSIAADTSFFETKKGRTGIIMIEYPFSEDFENNGLRIEGDVLTVPIIDKHYHLLKGRLEYVFNGDHFVYHGVTK